MSQVSQSAIAASSALPSSWRSGHSLSEIAQLLEQALKVNEQLERRLDELNGEVARYKNMTGGTGRIVAETSARERLVRDELERKVQSLQLELKQERIRMEERVLKMESELSGCLCRGSR